MTHYSITLSIVFTSKNTPKAVAIINSNNAINSGTADTPGTANIEMFNTSFKRIAKQIVKAVRGKVKYIMRNNIAPPKSSKPFIILYPFTALVHDLVTDVTYSY